MVHELVFVCFVLFTDWSYAFKQEGDACFSKFTGTEGRCVKKEQCHAATIDFVKFGIRPTPCGDIETSTFVCCRDPSATATPTTTTIITAITTKTKRPIRRKPGDISKKKCEEYTKAITSTVYGTSLTLHSVTQAYSTVKCTTYHGAGLIIGGETAQQEEFPHMAAVGWRKHDGKYTFDCGGTLIDKRFVLTAGHCTRNKQGATDNPEVVRLGDHNLDPNIDDGAHDILVRISKIYKHPNYKYTSKYNDIALLELESEVHFNNNIRPACLWTEDDFGGHENVVATGWGINNTKTRKKSSELLKVTLYILNNSDCNVMLANKIGRRWSHGPDTTQMCAGGKGQTKDTCEGDSGGPLQILSKENKCIFTVLGITSFGAHFCGDHPSVYTKVSSYIEWIENTVWPS